MMVITLRTIKTFTFCFIARTMPTTDIGMPAVREKSNNMSPALIRITASSKGIFGGSKTPSEANLNTMNNDKPRTVVISGVRIRNLAIDRTVLLLRVLLPALFICIPLVYLI